MTLQISCVFYMSLLSRTYLGLLEHVIVSLIQQLKSLIHAHYETKLSKSYNPRQIHRQHTLIAHSRFSFYNHFFCSRPSLVCINLSYNFRHCRRLILKWGLCPVFVSFCTFMFVSFVCMNKLVNFLQIGRVNTVLFSTGGRVRVFFAKKNTPCCFYFVYTSKATSQD